MMKMRSKLGEGLVPEGLNEGSQLVYVMNKIGFIAFARACYGQRRRHPARALDRTHQYNDGSLPKALV